MAPNIEDDETPMQDPMADPGWWKQKEHPPAPLLATATARAFSDIPSGHEISLHLPPWATLDPLMLGEGEPYHVRNCVGGVWRSTNTSMDIPHPLDKTKAPIFSIPDTQVNELQPFLESLRKVPKSGVHNPLKNNHRYLQYGEISRKVCGAYQNCSLPCVFMSIFSHRMRSRPFTL